MSTVSLPVCDSTSSRLPFTASDSSKIEGFEKTKSDTLISDSDVNLNEENNLVRSSESLGSEKEAPAEDYSPKLGQPNEVFLDVGHRKSMSRDALDDVSYNDVIPTLTDMFGGYNKTDRLVIFFCTKMFLNNNDSASSLWIISIMQSSKIE